VRKISPHTGIRSRTFQPVASRYTDWAIPAHKDRVTAIRNDLHHVDVGVGEKYEEGRGSFGRDVMLQTVQGQRASERERNAVAHLYTQ
jgi:hypothetical protein